MTEEERDRVYEQGFQDGLKWLARGLRVKLNTLLKDMEKAEKRVAPRTTHATDKKGT